MRSPERRSSDGVAQRGAGSLAGRRSPRLLWLVAFLSLAGCAVPVTGLRAEYPELRRFRTVTVESLQPVLRWEPFPRPRDRETVRTRARAVTYELEIWEAAGVFGELVYRRRGLKEPRHKVEEALKPGTRYSWTVRARFELDGNPRVTQWASREGGAEERRRVAWTSIDAALFGYAFKTPGVRTEQRGGPSAR